MSEATEGVSRDGALSTSVDHVRSHSACLTCAAPLGRNNRSGYCRKHYSAAQAQNPEWREKQRNGAKRALMADPVRREAQKARCRAFHGNPEITAKRRETAKRIRLWERGLETSHTPEALAKRAAAARATWLAWCPNHLREEYRRLVYVKRVPAAEAKAMILEQDAREVQALAKRMGVAVANEPVEIELPRFVYNIRRIGPREMILIVANVLDIEPDEITSPSRLTIMVAARAAIAKALRDRDMSLQAIADVLGRTDHSVALHTLNQFDDTAAREPRTIVAYEAIKRAEEIAAERRAA